MPGLVVGVHRAAHHDDAGHLVETRQPGVVEVEHGADADRRVDAARDQPGALVRGVHDHQDGTHAGHQPSGSGRPSVVAGRGLDADHGALVQLVERRRADVGARPSGRRR